MTCWHVITCKLVWNARNAVLRFGHLSLSLSCVRQGIHLAVCPLAPREAEGPAGLTGTSLFTRHKRRDTPKEG